MSASVDAGNTFRERMDELNEEYELQDVSSHRQRYTTDGRRNTNRKGKDKNKSHQYKEEQTTQPSNYSAQASI